jgi:hypothetical protein
MRAAGEQRLTSVRSASERVSETVIAAVLLLHERSVDDHSPALVKASKTILWPAAVKC